MNPHEQSKRFNSCHKNRKDNFLVFWSLLYAVLIGQEGSRTFRIIDENIIYQETTEVDNTIELEKDDESIGVIRYFTNICYHVQMLVTEPNKEIRLSHQ